MFRGQSISDLDKDKLEYYKVHCNIWDTTKNTIYTPYQQDSTDLSWIQSITYIPEGSTEPQQLFPNGLCSAGTVYDEITPTKAIKRVGIVDMGTLDQSTITRVQINYGTPNPHWQFNVVMSFRKDSGINQISNLFINTLQTNGYEFMSDKEMVGRGGQSLIYFRYDAATTVSDFLTAMSGVYLYYELAEPIEVPINHTIEYAVQPGGTEQLLPENTPSATPTTSEIIMDVTYPLDAVGTIQNLPTNYISAESMTAFVNAINTANVGFTVAMSYNSDTGKYSFVVTPQTV